MGEVIPGIAAFAIVLADRAPLPLAQVGSPFLPGDLRLARVVQAFLLGDIHNVSGHFSAPLFSYLVKSDLFNLNSFQASPLSL
jgi:hypothetical protein